MRNRLKQLLASGQPALGTWVGSTDPYVVELVAELGFDWLLIDMEHRPVSREGLCTILMACKGNEGVPIVRLPSLSPEHFQAALDLGAQGVMAPMVCSADDAARAVQSCRYPPVGARGFGPIRASRYSRDIEAYRREANDEVALFLQIETPEAAKNAAEILHCPGIDGIFIGNGDLANFMNGDCKPGSANVQQVVDELIEMARGMSLPVGLPTWSPEECNRYLQRGAHLLTIGTELGFLADRARTELSAVRRLHKSGDCPSIPPIDSQVPAGIGLK